MYSIVLVTALAAGSATPDFCHRGCYGCYSSYGYGCSGCYYGCGGCYGSAGCWYGGYGGSYAPYCGSYACYGCNCAYGSYGGNYWHGGCYGCSGCHDVCWQFSGYGCAGPGYGYGYGAPYVVGTVCSGCYGCHGGYSGYGVPLPGEGIVPPKQGAVDPFPAINPNPPKKDGKDVEVVPLPKDKKIDAPKKDVEEIKLPKELQSRAKIRIEVPVGGSLFVDGQPIPVAAGTRVFQTPLLTPGQRYFYDIRIDTVRNGQTESQQKRVILQPGQDLLVSFTQPSRGTYTVQAND
jgi:uncharacterized protein (TIGR03000 family)